MRPLRLLLLLALAVPAIPVYGQTAAPLSSDSIPSIQNALNSDSIQFVQNALTSTQAAEALEASLKANPDDRIAHIRLMGYYWLQSTVYNRADVRHQLMEQADWFAIHEPQSVVFDRSDFNLRPTDFSPPNSADFARYKADWIAAVQRLPNDTAVLLHALRALQAVDRDVPLFCEKRLRILMPTYPQFAVQLAGSYGQVIDIQWHNSGTSTAMTELMQSGDSAVIGLTGQILYAGSSMNGGVEGIHAIGSALLKKAHELDATNTRWTDALNAPAPATMNDAIASMTNLRQTDLWAGGKVRGIVVPATAITVDPAVQAAKLLSPNPVALKNILSAPLPGPGEVQLLAVIGPDGKVQQTQFDSGSARHFPYAMGMVQFWRYTPTLVNGQPVSVVTKIDLKYTPPFVVPGNPGVTEFARMLGGVAGSSGGVFPVLKTASPDVVKVAPDDLRALAVSEPGVPYPAAAKGQGLVILDAVITKTGDVQELAVYAGHPDFRQAALDGVKSWKYRPYLVTGEPREVQTTISVIFSGDGVKGVGTLIGSGLGAPVGGVAGMAGLGTANAPAAVPGFAVIRPAGQQSVSAGVIQGLAISQPQPVYPAVAKAAHVQGVVVLHAIISKQGTIEDLQVISGPPMLRASAIESVKNWTYRPYILNGEPTEVQTTINVNFTFGGSTEPAGTPAPQR